MAKTDTKDKQAPKTAEQTPQAAPEAKLPAALTLRMPYPKSLGEYADIDQRQWSVLIDAIWPSAKTVEGVCMAISYCKARNLDPFKKVVHIVPMYSKALKAEIETVWPGIAEVRITATRTGSYAGKDAALFGPDVTKTFRHIDDRDGKIQKEMEVTFPEWCEVTVYKIVQGVRCAFVGPKVYWEEAYATENHFSAIPNQMWADRRRGQLDKCAEAAALRAAFPEELGGEYTAEEMHGRVIEGTAGAPAPTAAVSPEMTPPRPKQSEFERKFEQQQGAAPAKEAAKPTPPADKGSDPRPEPPAEGDETVPEGEGVAVTRSTRNSETTSAAGGGSPSFAAAEKMLVKMQDGIAEIDDLDEFKKHGRTAIDSLEGLTDDERDVLRGRFTTLILTEQRGREKRGKK